MKIKVLLSNSIDPFHAIGTWAIKTSEETDFSHVVIQDGLEVFEAVFPKSRKIYSLDWFKKYKVVRSYEIELSLPQYISFMSIVQNDMKKKYSLFQCTLIWACNILGVLESKIKNIIWNGNKAMICSEVVAHPIAEVLKYNFGKQLDIVDLIDVENCLKKIGKLNEI